MTESIAQRYANGAERPLGSYGALMSTYGALVAGMVTFVRRQGVTVPARVGAADLALLTIATHKGSRLVAKDSVGAVVRAPFTQFEEAAGAGEVNESVVGTGLRHGVGELLTCPFCLAVWIATVLAFGLVVAPRFTRISMSVLTAVTGSDWLQFAYSALKETE